MPIQMPALSPQERSEFYRYRIQQNVPVYRRTARTGTLLLLAFSFLEFAWSEPSLIAALLVRAAAAGLLFGHMSTLRADWNALQYDRFVVRHAVLASLIACLCWSQLPVSYYFAVPAFSQVLLLSSLVLADSRRTLWMVGCVAPIEIFLLALGQPPRIVFVHTLTMLSALGVACVIALSLEAVRRREFLLERQLEREARTDSLTGLFNRRHLQLLGANEVTRSQRYQRPLAVILLDLDHFKKINDQHGHDIGDEVLRLISRRLREQVRGSDVVGRWGGEEFIILLPETELSDAQRLAERLRGSTESQAFPTSQGPLKVTLSCGVAAWDPGSSSWEEIVKAADVALYRAKNEGRNRVCVAA